MSTFKIALHWSESTVITVDADSLKEAKDKAVLSFEAEGPPPDGEYIDYSVRIDHGATFFLNSKEIR